MHALTAQNFRTGPKDRAAARRLIRDNHWYLDVFRQHDQAERESILVGLFWNSVIPDLADEQVLDELTYWAGTLAAPDAVINALYQATEAAAGAQPLVDRALAPALYRRWLNEHRIVVPAPAPGPAQGTTPGPGEQGTSSQRSAVPPALSSAGAQTTGSPTMGPQQATESRVPGGPQPTSPQAAAQSAVDWQMLLRLLEGKWNVPVPIFLLLCGVVIVLLIAR
jgi:hypothetical protein